jgi:hypothetical protein
MIGIVKDLLMCDPKVHGVVADVRAPAVRSDAAKDQKEISVVEAGAEKQLRGHGADYSRLASRGSAVNSRTSERLSSWAMLPVGRTPLTRGHAGVGSEGS